MNARYRTIEDIRAAIDADPTALVHTVTETLDGLEGDGRLLDAVVHIARDEALARAQELAEARNTSAPLFGVPMAHKDLYLRQGWPCTAGSKLLTDYRGERTAFVLERLDDAGAIDCGRLDSVEFGLGTTGHNDFSGTPHNPWNPAYICGGSSSGSAAVVAAGIVPAALGSDTGGSVRLPAAACGLVGVKPTHGLVGRSGVIALSPTLDTVGPLTRSVRDAALMLNVLAGFDSEDAASIEVAPVDHLEAIEAGMAGLRIGWPSNHFFDDAHAEVADNVFQVFDLAGRIGATCLDVAVPGIESANAMTMLLIAVEGLALHEKTLLEAPDSLGPQTRARLLTGAFISARDYCHALSSRAALAHLVLEETFTKVDILISPVWPYPLPTIAESDAGASPEAAAMVLRSGHNTRPVNYLGFPAVNIPVGFDTNGLPLSIQLIGKPWHESTLLRAARAIERELDFWSRRPDLSTIRSTTAPAHAV